MDAPRSSNLLGALALGLADRIQQAASEATDLSPTAATALNTVAAHPGETIEQLSRVLDLSHSATVRVVDRLQASGFLQRGQGHNARALGLELTEAGRAKVAAALAQRDAELSAILSLLGPRQQEQLSVLPETLLSRLTANRNEGRRVCRLCHEAVCRVQGCPVDAATHYV